MHESSKQRYAKPLSSAHEVRDLHVSLLIITVYLLAWIQQ